MSDQNPPYVSIILPLIFTRGYGLQCLAAWSGKQTYTRDRYEIIVVSAGDAPLLEQEIKKRLLPQDKIISSPIEVNHIELYNRGAKLAKGDWLVLCEGHSFGDPDCIEELLKHVTEQDLDGAAAHCVGIMQNVVARVEERIFKRSIQSRFESEHWNKVLLRGCIIKRSVYFECGGLKPEYEFFAETLLGIAIHQRGYRLGYARSAVVNHVNITSIKELVWSITSYLRTEYKYYHDSAGVFAQPYFQQPLLWRKQGWLDRRAIRYLWHAVGKSLTQDKNEFRRRLLNYLTLLPAALLGPEWIYLQKKIILNIRTWQCRLLLWHEHWLWLKCEFHLAKAVMNREQIRFLVRQKKPLPEFMLTGINYPLSTLSNRRMLGFYPEENHQSVSFFWTKPEAVLKLDFIPGDYLLKLAICPFRSAPESLQMYLNGKRINEYAFNTAGELQISVRKEDCNNSGEQYIVICCQPFSPKKYGSTDNRLLGLPISGLCLSLHPAA